MTAAAGSGNHDNTGNIGAVDKMLLLTAAVAGRQYWCADDLWECLHPGLPLLMTAEPDNAHDPWAVALAVEVDGAAYKIGYLPQGRNRMVSALLAMGWGDALQCCLTRVDPAAEPECQLTVAVKVVRRHKSS